MEYEWAIRTVAHSRIGDTMRLGYCCINLQLRNSTNPIYTGRTCTEGRFSRELAGELGMRNTADLIKIIEWNELSGIKVFRVSSHMFPHATNPKVLYCPADLPQGSQIRRNLRHAGKLAEKYGHVLSMHPPHFVSLASDSEEIQRRSIQELEHHEWIAGELETDSRIFVNMNYHVGRNFDAALVPRFRDNFFRLPVNMQTRTCIENDDNVNGWSVQKLHDHLWRDFGVRVSFDAFHWWFCPGGQTREEAFRLAKKTWQCNQMECHMSSSAERWPRTPTHAAYLWEDIPEYMLTDDVYTLIEAGAKEMAVFEYAREHGIILNPSPLMRLP